MIYPALLASLLAAGVPDLNPKERLYQHACYTGVSTAQSVLPKVPQEDELMGRGFASCDGSIVRMRKTGDLDREQNIPEFACGYAVGATFAKYGLSSEVQARSPRALRAVERCMQRLRNQGAAK
jgi:hypothetical protein